MECPLPISRSAIWEQGKLYYMTISVSPKGYVREKREWNKPFSIDIQGEIYVRIDLPQRLM